MQTHRVAVDQFFDLMQLLVSGYNVMCICTSLFVSLSQVSLVRPQSARGSHRMLQTGHRAGPQQRKSEN